MMDKFTVDDKEYFIKITSDDLSKAKIIHAKTFRSALEGGALLRRKLSKYMEDQGIWDDSKENEYNELLKKIAKLESELSTGKVDGRMMKVSEGRAKAIELSETRAEFKQLISERTALDTNTAEGQADNERFNYLVSACIYDYETQKPVFESLEDYYKRGSDEVAVKLAGKLANHLYNIDENYEKNYAERKFLRRFGLIDDQDRFIKDGKFVDADGHQLDEEGFRINANGERVDAHGNLIGDVETAEFEID